VPLPARLAQLAEFVEVANRVGGVRGAKALARRRGGKQFDPALAKLVVDDGELILAGVDSATAWDDVIDAEPALAITLAEAEFDPALASIANFVDLKSPYFLGHALAVAELAEAAAKALGLDETLLRRAGLVHGLGRLGISNAIWDKRGPLGVGERERVRLQPYLTERMLGRSEALAPFAAIVAQMRERLDGSGYPLRLSGGAISRPARVLAAAEAYQAMREPRPHRPQLSAEAAAAELRADAKAGRLDPEAVEAVLGAAGHRVPRRRGGPAGLTTREIEVLRLVARGLSNKEIAGRLVITPKTVGNHVEHIYRKIEASTRAAASLYAMQQGLLPEEELPDKDGVNAS
jgi:DNA-binding CsgD family transcriptional regulator